MSPAIQQNTLPLQTDKNNDQHGQSEPPLVCVSDYAVAARGRLSTPALGYYASGALAQTTLADNAAAMISWYILPRVLRDVSHRSLHTTVLGHRLRLPFAIAPTAMQRMAHPDGECASVAAAGKAGTIFTLSTISTSSIEEVAQHGPDTIKFFQLYIYKDRSITERLVLRAELCGYRAIVLTVDAPTFGMRRPDLRNKFTLPSHLRMANFEESSSKSSQVNSSQGGSGINEYVSELFDDSITWQDLTWLTKLTSLPVIVKGIMTREDARAAVGAGVAAVWVSNHGGRQVDGAPPTIEILPHIVAEVSGQVPVFVDGGFTQGTDVFKGLALGADLVFIGRPVLWGLAIDGHRGVENILDIIARELGNTMANAGCSSIKSINRSMVIRREQYSKL